MRIQAYLRVVSDEATIKRIHTEAEVSEARIMESKAPRRGTVADERWWIWRTPRVPIDVDDPDRELKGLLSQYRPVFPKLKKYKGSECDIYLEVVMEYEEGEDPRGLCLSSETISLLNELGGALDK